ncbi:MAG TPA: matrixin family metalloprotease, partial [bacterium]|nr:matrixin family metalloprotease [bacterium]
MPVSLEINKWPDPRIRWALASSNWPGLEYARVREAFAWAWSQWEAVCGIAPEFAESPGQAHVVIECARIDQPGQVLAWSELANNTMQAKRQRYDASENWAYTESPRPHEIDLARVAGHEIGHVLGIGHIASGNLLQPTYDTRIRGPQAGDIAEARARYGPPRNVPPPSPPHPPTPVSAGELTIKVKQAGGKFSVDLGPGFRVIPI